MIYLRIGDHNGEFGFDYYSKAHGLAEDTTFLVPAPPS